MLTKLILDEIKERFKEWFIINIHVIISFSLMIIVVSTLIISSQLNRKVEIYSDNSYISSIISTK